jgi:Lar family restriction alleviation protein
MTFLPCPFCGNQDIKHESMGAMRYARCQNCSASGGYIFAFDDSEPFAKETVVKRWNTRYEENKNQVNQQGPW